MTLTDATRLKREILLRSMFPSMPVAAHVRFIDGKTGRGPDRQFIRLAKADVSPPRCRDGRDAVVHWFSREVGSRLRTPGARIGPLKRLCVRAGHGDMGCVGRKASSCVAPASAVGRTDSEGPPAGAPG